MLDQLFIQVLDMSKTASVVILAVLLARLCLKKAPKIVSYALWAVVLFRLLCPLSMKAPVSLVPELTPTAQTYSLADAPISVAGTGFAAYQAVGDALNGGLGVQHIPTTETDEAGATRYVTSSWRDVCILFGQYVWVAGIAAMVLHSAVSYGKLRRRLKIAVPLRDNLYLADHIQSPFVIGLLRPKIYLPCGLGQQEQEYIICHERHHIKRLDHVCKALAYLALCIHWFNPLVWLAFVLAGKDMEMSCDEAVVRQLGSAIRADYSASLLALPTGRRIIAGTPLAFGEGNAKARIRNLGKWKQPVQWMVVAAAAAVLALTVCLATNPTGGSERLREIHGLVTALRTEDNGNLTALVIETAEGKETGILLTEDTLAYPPESGQWTSEELRAAFQAAIRPDTRISADCARDKKALITDSGAPVTAHEARFIRVTGQLNRGAITMQDGTQIDVMDESVPSRRTYRLADGTELLRVNRPAGPNDVYGGESACFDDLSETAQAQVLAYYAQRGLLYDEQAELEKVYALYQALGADFHPGLVEQSVSPTASSDRVIYFLTTVTLPTGQENGNIVQERRLCDAFDRETGAHIDTWDLFAAPKEEVKKTLLDACGITDQRQRAEMEAVPWDGHIEFFPDGLSVTFEPGALPSEIYGSGFGVDYTPAILELMRDWAVPNSAIESEPEG